MAHATTETLLPLSTWARIMGLSLWELNQVGDGFPTSTQSDGSCTDVWYQDAWQRDRLSREELARTIARAEMMVADYLGYFPAPKYLTNEPLQPSLERYYAGGLGTHGLDWHRVGTRYRHMTAAGVRAYTLIDNAAAVTASDPDSDGVDELFTVTVATSVTDNDQIGVYFSSADRFSEAIGEQWRIRPVTVTISGGNATITGHRALLVKPIKQTIVNPDNLDVTTAANFVTTVAIYRVYTDTTQQGTAYWDYTATDTLSEPSSATSKSLKFMDDVQSEGRLFVTWNDDGGASGYRAPDRTYANYVSGLPLINGQMHPDFQVIIAYLTTGLLPQDSCGCERTDRLIAYWRRDVTIGTGQNDPGRFPTAEEVGCPFGYTRGALWAWERLKKKRESNIWII